MHGKPSGSLARPARWKRRFGAGASASHAAVDDGPAPSPENVNPACDAPDARVRAATVLDRASGWARLDFYRSRTQHRRVARELEIRHRDDAPLSHENQRQSKRFVPRTSGVRDLRRGRAASSASRIAAVACGFGFVIAVSFGSWFSRWNTRPGARDAW